MVYVHPQTQLLIFDCDGTLADTMDIHYHAWQAMIDKYHFPIDLAGLAKFNGVPTLPILQQLYPNGMHNYDLEAMVIEKETLAHQALQHTKPILPLIEVVYAYHGKIPMVVISGGERNNVIKTLESLEILDRFEEVITADDDHPYKNDPRAFTLIADKYNADYSKTHVFEDGIPGLMSALQAGMMVTDVRTIYP